MKYDFSVFQINHQWIESYSNIIPGLSFHCYIIFIYVQINTLAVTWQLSRGSDLYFSWYVANAVSLLTSCCVIPKLSYRLSQTSYSNSPRRKLLSQRLHKQHKSYHKRVFTSFISFLFINFKSAILSVPGRFLHSCSQLFNKTTWTLFSRR